MILFTFKITGDKKQKFTASAINICDKVISKHEQKILVEICKEISKCVTMSFDRFIAQGPLVDDGEKGGEA